METILQKHRRRYLLSLWFMILLSIIIFLLSLMIGQFGFMPLSLVVKALLNSAGANFALPRSTINIVWYLRLPRAWASFLVGGALSISGIVYQNTFNNKLVSPDILGVTAGSCVGAGIAILLGMSGANIGIFAFATGFISVLLALFLPSVFRNKSSITLVLSGIIVSSFMDSIVGLIKYIADTEEKLSEITFWIMGSVNGVSVNDILAVLPLLIIPTIILLLMSHRIDVISLGAEEAQSLGINYRINRLIVVACSTCLTAASVSISGNVSWVGLVIPHISRAIVGNKARESMPIALLFGGSFMMIVDLISRNVAKDDIPLSIITGILGAAIYAVVLARKGRDIHD